MLLDDAPAAILGPDVAAASPPAAPAVPVSAQNPPRIVAGMNGKAVPRPLVVSINRLAGFPAREGRPAVVGCVLFRHGTIGAALRYAERVNRHQRQARPGLDQDVVSVHVVNPADDLDGDRLLAGRGRRVVLAGPLPDVAEVPAPKGRRSLTGRQLQARTRRLEATLAAIEGGGAAAPGKGEPSAQGPARERPRGCGRGNGAKVGRLVEMIYGASPPG